MRKTHRTSSQAEKGSKAPVSVDHPAEGENVLPSHYAIRVSAPGADAAEVAINDQEWQECRTASGYFWFDWYPVVAGGYKIAVRARTGKGRWRQPPARNCVVSGLKLLNLA